MDSLNTTLEELYQRIAKPKGFPDGYSKLSIYIEKVLEIVEEKHRRFNHTQYALVGSSATDVSSILTKEMDRVFVIDIKGNVEDMPQSPGFAKFKVDTSARDVWCDCIDDAGYLEPRKVASAFKSCVEEADAQIKQEFPNGLPGITDLLTEIEVGGGDSVAVTIAGSFGPLSWAFGKVKCDLVLVIGQNGLPPSSLLAPWLVKPAHDAHQWPTKETIDEIKDIGYGLVTKDITEGDSSNQEDLPVMWRYSVSRAETCLLRHLNDKRVYRKLLIILKTIRLHEIPEQSNFSPILTSYHMKTIFLHEAHSYPKEADWTSDKFGERLLSSLKRLLACVKKKELPHFIFPQANLFRVGQCGDEQMVEKMIKDPVAYLKEIITSKKPLLEGQFNVNK